MITPKDKAEELLMYYMQIPKDGGYVIDVDHGKRNAFKAIIEVQYGIAETGHLSGFWYQTGVELEKIYTKYKHQYKNEDAE